MTQNTPRTFSDIFETALSNLTPSLRSTGQVITGDGVFSSIFGGKTKNGTVINSSSALTLSAVFNAVDIISNDLAKLSVNVIKKTGDKRETISDHKLNYLFSVQPNKLQTAFNYRKSAEIVALLKGNFYAKIARDPFTAEPVSLTMWDSDAVTPIKFEDALYYKYKGVIYSSDDVYHIPGFSLNGIVGISIIKFCAMSLGVSLSSQEFAQEYYNGKGVGSGIITTPKGLEINKTGKRKVSQSVSDVLTTISPWKIPVLDEGMIFTPLKITAQEANFIATNKFGIEEVSRWFNIPPHKLGALDRSTNNNIEHQSLEYVQDTILPRVVRNEQEVNRKLFTVKEQQSNYKFKFNIKSLLRADMSSQADYYAKMTLAGIITRAEVREKEDLNPIEGLDAPLTPVNVFTPELIANKIKNESKN